MDLLRSLAFLLACGSAVFAVAGVGGAVSDRLDVLTHFAPLYLAGGLIALILALSLGAGQGWRETLLFAAAAIVIATALMAPDAIAAASGSPAAPGKRLKIIQFNLWSANRSPAATAAWIARQDADIVVLEEAHLRGGLVADALQGQYPYRTFSRPRPGYATLILSKAAPVASGVFPSPDGEAVHSGAWARFDAGAEAYTVVGVHLSWPFPPGKQQAQARVVASELDGLDRRSLILAGDFNSTPWSFSMRRMDREFGLTRRTHFLFSWPARTYGHKFLLRTPFPVLPIDHVFAGAAWRTLSVARGPQLGSDHYPVVVTLARVS